MDDVSCCFQFYSAGSSLSFWIGVSSTSHIVVLVSGCLSGLYVVKTLFESLLVMTRALLTSLSPMRIGPELTRVNSSDSVTVYCLCVGSRQQC